MRNIGVKVLGTMAVAFTMWASPAMAQATRTYVSGVGDDANPCSRTAPCRTFQSAISKTVAGGEINVLDPGGYGAVTITKSVTIRSDSVAAGIVVTGTNAIIVNAAVTDKVVLDGLDLEGLALSPSTAGLSGVRILSARDVVILNSTIRNFGTAGVQVSSGGQTRVTIDHVTFINNAIGVSVAPTGAASNSVKISNSRVAVSSTAAISLVGANASGYISNVVVLGTPKSLDLQGGAVMNSYGNNVLNGTSTDAPTLVPLN